MLWTRFASAFCSDDGGVHCSQFFDKYSPEPNWCCKDFADICNGLLIISIVWKVGAVVCVWCSHLL